MEEGSQGQQNKDLTTKRKDPAWQYNYLSDPKDTNTVTCMFCNKVTKGGIHRAKWHQIGGHKDVARCLKCPEHVRKELKEYIEGKKQHKETYDKPSVIDIDIHGNQVEIEEVEEEEDEGNKRKGKTVMTHPMQKKAKQKGPLDSFMRQKPEVVVQLRKEGKLRQSNVTEKFDKERRAMVCQYIGRFFYQAGIPFNVARMDSFKWMIEAIGQYGPNLQPPSYHELRVPILKKEVELTNDMMKSHKDRWKRHGCSIMSDGWTSRTNRTLINFLVNCPVGTMFVKSVDASSYVKTSEKLFKLLDDFVEYVGEENVVQVVTDNGSNFKAAGRLLELKRPHLYCTPCAAHCLDLILEDIGKIPKVSRTIERAISLTGYIYNHVGVLNMMRTFTNQRELVRPGKTRFCTSYLSLKCIHQQKTPLRSMFTSQEWSSSKWSKEAKGKHAMETVLMPSFWNSVVYILKVMGPLVRVLRLVDNEKRPAMGYIYEAMDRAKEAIQTSFNGKEEKYKDIFKIIDERWDCQLHQPLHAAAHFLDPEFFYDNQNLEYDQEVTSGLITCISRLVKDFDTQKRIMAELTIYKRAEGLFDVPLAIRTRKTRAPAEWWSTYGSSTPNLQQLAIRILGLTCSASGCEHNWSVFEQLRDGSNHQGTVTSMEPNEGTFVLHSETTKKGKIQPVHIVDVPGHSRLRPKLDEYLPKAAGIVFVVDALEFLPNCRAASEYLYDILTKGSVVRKKIPLLILCNKTDKVTAHSKEFIRRQMEKEIDKLRASRSAISAADIANEFTLGVAGEPFSFSQCSNEVTTAEASGLNGEISQLEQFIRKYVKP